jgi:hypothetical protein
LRSDRDASTVPASGRMSSSNSVRSSHISA